MKYARQRWIGAAAVLFGGLIAPVSADPIIFPEDSAVFSADDSEGSVVLPPEPETEAAVTITDATGSVRTGQSASASLSTTPHQQAQYVTPPPAPAPNPLAAPQINRPTQPILPQAANPYGDAGVGFAQTQPSNDILWRVGRTNMNQFGVNGGYTQFNAFAPLFSNGGDAVTFINPRIGVTDYRMAIANVGVGQRFYSPSQDRVWGASAWWDYDNGNVHAFNQFGGSFESIGQYISWRGNFVIPVGTRAADYGLTYGTATFQGSNISVPYTYFTQSAYQQYNIEAAVPFPVLGRYGFDLGLGIYQLTGGEGRNATGASIRTQAQITENVWLNGWYTYDRVFESKFTINCEFTLPSGRRSRFFRRNPVKKYLTQSVIRPYRVAVGTSTGSGSTLATDANGNLINVAYIDPNATTPGTGTVENPFMSVQEYMSLTPAQRDIYSMIFVDPRNDATSTNLDTGIGLLDNQILVGNGPTASGNVPSITAYVNGTAQTIDLQITGTSQPFLSNAGAPGTDVITLADNNEVVGFKISATNTANGISGTLIDGFNIHDNSLLNVIDGIHITSDTSTGSSDHYGQIMGNTITGKGGGAYNGIYIDQAAGTLKLLVDDNTITGFLGEDANANSTLDPGEDANANLVLDVGHGLFVQASGGNIVANDLSASTPTGITGNNISANGNGVQLSAINGRHFDLALSGNNITGNLNSTLGGALLLADNASTFNVSSVTGNNVNNNVGNGLTFQSQGGSTMNIASMTGNNFNSNGGDGVAYIADNGNMLITGTTSNSFNENTGNGASFLADNAGDLYVRGFYGNSLSKNTQDGVSFIGRDGGILTVPEPEDFNQNGSLNTGEDLNTNGILDRGFYGNIVTSNLNNGVSVLADNSTNVEVHIGSARLVPETSSDSPNNPLRNQINDNGRLVTIANETTVEGSGVYVATANGGTVVGGIDGNTISANGSAGIQIAPENGTVNLNSISNNFILNNGLVDGNPLPSGVTGGDAIMYAPSTGGSFSVGDFVDNTISGNHGAIIHVAGDGGTIDLGTIQGTTFDLRTAGTSGILFDATNATITGTLINNIFIGSADNEDLSFGVGGNLKGGTLDLTIVDNLFDTTAGAGIGLILGASDTRPGPGPGTPPIDSGVGTPLEGQAVDANVTIVGNTFQNILAGTDPNFEGSGISIQLEGRDHTNVGDPSQPNGDGSDVNNNIDPGVHFTGNITQNTIGSLNGDFQTGDTLVTNAGPGIQILASGDATIDHLTINQNIIANNRSDGIQIRRSGSGIVNDTTISQNVIQNNLEDGIDIVGSNSGIPYGVAEILDFNINNNQILNNGFLTDGTQGSAGRGIQLRAEVSAVMDVDIGHNIISGNRLSGIEARTATDTYLYDGPLNIPDRIGGSDGIIYGTWEYNLINQNGFVSSEDTNHNGILDAGEDANGNGSLDVVRAGDGISLGRINMVDPDSPAGIIEGFNNGGMTLPDGSLPLLTIQNNSIAGNALNGIQVFLDKSTVLSASTDESFPTNGEFVRTTNVDVLNNDIIANGSNGFLLNNASQASSTATFNFNNNLVKENGLYSGLDYYAGRTDVKDIGDGVEIVNAWHGTTNFNAANNSVVDNNGRGFNILNAGAIATYGSLDVLNLNLDHNTIEGNAREGFYLVNAPLTERVNGNGISKSTPVGTIYSGYTSTSWLADTDSNHTLFDYGRSFKDYAPNTPPASVADFLDGYSSGDYLTTRPVTNLTFTNNIVDNNGSYVNSAASGVAYNTVGGFVIRVGSSNSNTGMDMQTTAGENGGVVADVENNRMSGNVGRDVYFNGFVATNPPYVSQLADPLIRFDLTFENNTGGSISVNNFDAFYTNTAPVRTPPGNVKRPNPPYTTADAQAGARPAWLGLGTGLGGLTLPGYGTSTLRVKTDGAGGSYGIGNNTFNLIYSGFGSQWLVVPEATVFPQPFLP